MLGSKSSIALKRSPSPPSQNMISYTLQYLYIFIPTQSQTFSLDLRTDKEASIESELNWRGTKLYWIYQTSIVVAAYLFTEYFSQRKQPTYGL